MSGKGKNCPLQQQGKAIFKKDKLGKFCTGQDKAECIPSFVQTTQEQQCLLSVPSFVNFVFYSHFQGIKSSNYQFVANKIITVNANSDSHSFNK